MSDPPPSRPGAPLPPPARRAARDARDSRDAGGVPAVRLVRLVCDAASQTAVQRVLDGAPRDAQGRNWNIPALARGTLPRTSDEADFRRVVDALRDQFDLA